MISNADSSLDNIPKSLEGLTEDVLQVFKTVFNKDLISVYAVGSWVRLQMREDSDADFIGIVTTVPDTVKLNTFFEAQKALKKNWTPHLVYDIDLKLIDTVRHDYYLNIIRNVVVAADGCLLYGIQNERQVSQTKTDIVSAFVRLFLEYFAYKLDLHSELESTRYKSRKVAAKLTLRCIEWIAVLKGANITSDMQKYLLDIEQFAQSQAEEGRLCWRLLHSATIDDSELRKVYQALQSTLVLMEKKGVDIDQALKQKALLNFTDTTKSDYL